MSGRGMAPKAMHVIIDGSDCGRARSGGCGRSLRSRGREVRDARSRGVGEDVTKRTGWLFFLGWIAICFQPSVARSETSLQELLYTGGSLLLVRHGGTGQRRILQQIESADRRGGKKASNLHRKGSRP